MTTKEFFTERELSEILGVTKETMAKRRREVRCPRFLRLGRRVGIRYRWSDVVKWVEASTVRPEKEDDNATLPK